MNLNLKDYGAVIFDMDGVLINSEPVYIKSQKEIFAKLGLNISEKEQQTFQGTATDEMWKIIKQKHTLFYSIDELVEMSNSNVLPYFQSSENFIMPGVKDLLEVLQKKKTALALASSSELKIIQLILSKTEFKKYFSVIVDSQMAGASKPEPDIFLMAAKQLGLEPENCLVIEDSKNGIKAAKRARMKVVAYNGPGAELQDQSEADWIIRDFKEISELV